MCLALRIVSQKNRYQLIGKILREGGKIPYLEADEPATSRLLLKILQVAVVSSNSDLPAS